MIWPPPTGANLSGGQGRRPRLRTGKRPPAANSIFRAATNPSGAVDPTHPNRIVVAFGSYIGPRTPTKRDQNPAFLAVLLPREQRVHGVKDSRRVQERYPRPVSRQTGALVHCTTTDPRTLPAPPEVRAGDGRPVVAAGRLHQGRHLAISYYDRQYGTDESPGSRISACPAERLRPLRVGPG